MNTRSLAARLKRLEFRLAPQSEPLQIHIDVVGSKGVIYKMLWGPKGKEYFSPDDRPITKDEADQLSAASRASEMAERFESHRQTPSEP